MNKLCWVWRLEVVLVVLTLTAVPESIMTKKEAPTSRLVPNMETAEPEWD